MWALIKSFFGGISATVVEVFVSVATVLGVVIAIFQQGKKSQKADDLQKVVKDEQTAQTIKNQNAALPDGAAAEQLRDKWS